MLGVPMLAAVAHNVGNRGTALALGHAWEAGVWGGCVCVSGLVLQPHPQSSAYRDMRGALAPGAPCARACWFMRLEMRMRATGKAARPLQPARSSSLSLVRRLMTSMTTSKARMSQPTTMSGAEPMSFLEPAARMRAKLASRTSTRSLRVQARFALAVE